MQNLRAELDQLRKDRAALRSQLVSQQQQSAARSGVMSRTLTDLYGPDSSRTPPPIRNVPPPTQSAPYSQPSRSTWQSGGSYNGSPTRGRAKDPPVSPSQRRSQRSHRSSLSSPRGQQKAPPSSPRRNPPTITASPTRGPYRSAMTGSPLIGPGSPRKAPPSSPRRMPPKTSSPSGRQRAQSPATGGYPAVSPRKGPPQVVLSPRSRQYPASSRPTTGSPVWGSPRRY